MKNYLKFGMLLFVAILSSCVQEEHEKQVTLSVDMNGTENVESVGIRGDFLPNKWRETVPMSDNNNDGIYEITFSEKTAVYGIEFKFVKNNDEFELQNQNNRELVFEYKPETIQYIAKFNNNKDTKINRK